MKARRRRNPSMAAVEKDYDNNADDEDRPHKGGHDEGGSTGAPLAPAPSPPSDAPRSRLVEGAAISLRWEQRPQAVKDS